MSTLKTIFMFSGQGSQYYRMGEPLYQGNPVFRSWMDRLDGYCRDAFGASIVSMIYDQKRTRADPFERTPLSGPAIFMVEYALAKALEDSGVRADMTLGASLGTYAAAAISGAIEPEDAIASIMQQSRVLQQHCSAGGMLAVVAEPSTFDLPALCTRSELAALNFSSHFVIAALDEPLMEIERFLEGRGITHQRLPVSYAFHSRWIDNAYAPLLRSLEAQPLRPLRIPLICCAQAGVVETCPPELLWNVIRDPIRFSETIAALAREQPYRYIDVGPSGTLAAFMRYLLPAGHPAQVQKVLSPFGGEVKSYDEVVRSARVVEYA